MKNPATDRARGAGRLTSEARRLSSALPPLLIEAERVAASVRQGTHGRRRAGQGESFWQFQHYNPGDAASRIDWRQSARTDKLFVREREWEAAQSVYLWADASGSMRYSSQRELPTKAERARLLMLALAYLLMRGGEKAIWYGAEPVAVQSDAALARIAAEPESDLGLPQEIAVPRHAHMVLCGDFLAPPEELEQLMRSLTAKHAKGALLHILDPAEESLPFEGRIEMEGCEGEEPLLLPNAAALRAAYITRMTEHKARLARLAASAGWFYLRHETSEPPETVLLQLYELLGENTRGF